MKNLIKVTLFFSLLMVAGNLYAFDAGNVEIHGFVSQGYMKSSDNNFLADTEDGTFQFNELGINFGTWLTADLRLGMQLFARDLGAEGNDEVVVDWAFADYAWKEWMGLRVGKMKLVGGVYNEVRDMDMIRTSALLPQSIYPELYRDTFTSIKGFGLYGKIPLSLMGSLSYTGQMGVLPIKADGGFADAFIQNVYIGKGYRVTVDSMDHDYYSTFQGKWHTPLTGLTVGGSCYEFDGLIIEGDIVSPVSLAYSYDVKTMSGRYYSVEYTWENLQLLYEETFMNIKGELTAGPMVVPSRAPLEGWYAAGSYRFTEWFELGAGYSEYYPRSTDKDGKTNDIPTTRRAWDFENWLKDANVSFRFDVNENWIIKLEVHDMNGFGSFSTAENELNDLEEDWMLYVAKITYSF